MIVIETKSLENEIIGSFSEVLFKILPHMYAKNIKSIVTYPNVFEERFRRTMEEKNNISCLNKASEFNQSDFVKLLYGNTFISHRIDNLVFNIHPCSFFQPNLYQIDCLYSSIEKCLELDKKTILWDLFCGTGTIGQYLESKVSHVFGKKLELK